MTVTHTTYLFWLNLWQQYFYAFCDAWIHFYGVYMHIKSWRWNIYLSITMAAAASASVAVAAQIDSENKQFKINQHVQTLTHSHHHRLHPSNINKFILEFCGSLFSVRYHATHQLLPPALPSKSVIQAISFAICTYSIQCSRFTLALIRRAACSLAL